MSQKQLKVVTDINQIEDASLDYIYSLNVLEHIEQDAEMLSTLTQKLKPGGRILIYVPAMPLLFSSMDRKVCHFRRYTRSSLGRLADTAGLDIQYHHYADCIGFFATLAYKWSGNTDGSINLRALITYDRFIFPLSKALDYLFRYRLGKNVYLLARRPENDST